VSTLRRCWRFSGLHESRFKDIGGVVMIVISDSAAGVNETSSAYPGRRTSGETRDYRNAVCRGWLIARIRRCDAAAAQRAGQRPLGAVAAGYLQLATGQWCPPSAATWFPLRSAAAAYAADVCCDRKHDIVIVFRQRGVVPGQGLQGMQASKR